MSVLLRIINSVLLPLKLIVPQPIIARIPGLTTNEDIRLEQVSRHIRGRLLDIGCGANRLVREYRAQGHDGIGVDVYPWPGVDQVVEDSARLPFDDASFDTVTLVACINHIPNRGEVLKEARRVLKPEGRLILTNLTPVLSRLWHWYAFWDKDQHERGMQAGEVWGLEGLELRQLLRAAGFSVDRFERFSLWLNQLYVCVRAD